MTVEIITSDPGGEFAVVSLSGEIDLGNAETIEAELVAAVPDEAAGLVVDLGSVRYLDSAGVHMLFGLIRQLASSRQHVALALPETSPLWTLLKVTNMNEAAPVVTSIDAAIDVLSADIELS